MPQVSIYIDEETYQRIVIAAKTEKVSLSKFVTRKLRHSLEDTWPVNYDRLFGAIDDPDFGVPPPQAEDSPREQL